MKADSTSEGGQSSDRAGKGLERIGESPRRAGVTPMLLLPSGEISFHDNSEARRDSAIPLIFNFRRCAHIAKFRDLRINWVRPRCCGAAELTDVGL